MLTLFKRRIGKWPAPALSQMPSQAELKKPGQAETNFWLEGAFGLAWVLGKPKPLAWAMVLSTEIFIVYNAKFFLLGSNSFIESEFETPSTTVVNHQSSLLSKIPGVSVLLSPPRPSVYFMISLFYYLYLFII